MKSKPDNSPTVDIWYHERSFYEQGFTKVAGIDEVGRGPLAGPVVAACVILPMSFKSEGVNDSKKLTPRQRERAFARICQEAIAFAIGIVEPCEIDAINILRATHLAMLRSVQAIEHPPDVLLIDGLPVPRMLECHQLALVSGDSLSVSIASASIVAKVTRDQMMCDFADIYPEYGFDQHKGYGAPRHVNALREHGPCPIHRRSFSPVSELLQPLLL